MADTTDPPRVVLAEVEEDGVRYRLEVNRLAPTVFDGAADRVQQEPKVVAEKA